jgi:hypothetical protein
LAALEKLDLSRLVIHAGAVQELRDGWLAVETPAAQWAYAVEIPLPRYSLDGIETIRIKLEASVDCGRLGIGILERGGRSFVHESLIGSEDNQWCEELFLGPLCRLRSVVIRNVSDTGVASRGSCRISAMPIGYADQPNIERGQISAGGSS